MVYPPVGRPFKVRMERINGGRVTAWGFDPRTGKASPLRTFNHSGERGFSPPKPGELLDWVLVLDNESNHFPPPGTAPDLDENTPSRQT